MGRSSYKQIVREEKPRVAPIHPIWRGVGFGLMILVPIISYAGSLVLLQQNGINGWFPIPGDLLVSGLGDQLILVKAILTVILMFILYAIMLLFYFIIYALVGPKRYLAPDVAPVKYRYKRKSR